MKRLFVILLLSVFLLPALSWAQDCKGCPASKSCSKAKLETAKNTVYVIKGETVFHKKACELLKEKEVVKFTTEEVKKKEFKPCSLCFPPVVKIKKATTQTK